MGNVVLKLEELEESFWRVTMLILGLDPDSEDEKEISKVRISWLTDGAPSWGIDEDVCFISVTPRDDLINRQRNTRYKQVEEELHRITEHTRVINCSFILYGPNSYDNAELIQHSLFLPEYKEMLNEKYLYLIPNIAAPIRSPELFSGRWWERSNFEANFNLYVRREQKENSIEDVEIRFINKKFSTERRIIDGDIKP